MPPLPPPRVPRSRRPLLIGVGLAVVVALALVIALVLGGDDDDPSVVTDDGTPITTVAGGVAPAENQPVTVTGSPLPPLPEAGVDDALGLTAPRLDGFGFDGAPVTVEPGGTTKMIVFLAHWCPHCNREIPRLLQWEADGEVPDGLELIGVTTATDSSAPNYPPSRWLEEKGWQWPVLADSQQQDAAAAFGVNGFPYFVIVGADGTVKVRFSGEVEIEQLDGIVRNALNQ